MPSQFDSEMPREALYEPFLFSPAEHAQRLDRLGKALRRVELTSYVVVDPANQSYLGGGAPPVDRGSAAPARFIVVTRRGEIRWLVHEEEHAEIAACSAIDRVDTYADDADAERALAGLLRAPGQRPGFDAAPVLSALGRSIAPTETVDLVGPLRVAKSAAEISRIRRAATMASRALRRVLDRLRAEMTEREIATVGYAALATEGAHEGRCTVLSGNDLRLGGIARNSRPSDGAIILIRLAARYAGYWSAIGRPAVRAPMDAVIATQLERAEEVADRLRRSIVVGRAIGECAALARTRRDELGLIAGPSHVEGHGLGIAAREGPSLRVGIEGSIEAGAVFVLSPSIGPPLRVSVDTVVAREAGADILTNLPREPFAF